MAFCCAQPVELSSVNETQNLLAHCKTFRTSFFVVELLFVYIYLKGELSLVTLDKLLVEKKTFVILLQSLEVPGKLSLAVESQVKTGSIPFLLKTKIKELP